MTPTTTTTTKKRGRWDDSSDDEDDDDTKVGKKPQDQDQQQQASKTSTTEVTKNSSASASVSSSNIKIHNPLLDGCRSVYDTYERIEKISEGTYGIVWKARDLTVAEEATAGADQGEDEEHDDDDEIVALKQIKFDSNVENQQGFPVTALREINVLMELFGHRNLVSVKEMVVGSDTRHQIYMVMEYFDLDLCQAMSKRVYPNVLRQGELKGVLQQILQGMAYMHSKYFMHRDMKTSNILVHKSDGRVALCDLGLARRYTDPPSKNLTHPVVTLYYRAPELLFGQQKYTPAIDMWSVGCIFGELITQQPIMTGQGELDQIDKIFTMLGTGPTQDNWPGFAELPTAKIFKWRPKGSGTTPLLQQLFPSNPLQAQSSKQTYLDGNGYDLLTKLLTLDPSKRITAQDALDHKYFTEGVKPTPPNFWDF